MRMPFVTLARRNHRHDNEVTHHATYIYSQSKGFIVEICNVLERDQLPICIAQDNETSLVFIAV